ncbi:MAG: YrhK family protein [Geminicoccaceae bacterium]
MPHMFTDRDRMFDLLDSNPDLRDQFRWETINAILYKVGGLMFIAGSIMFFPALEKYADLGAWIFFAGSLLYLLVTGHDLVEVITYRHRLDRPPKIWRQLEAIAAVTYFTGTILFAIGSVFFLSWVSLFRPGAWCFVIGSLLFVVGAIVNVLQIVTAKDMTTLQLMNLTALAFVAGSVLFTVASVPYLWQFASHQDERMVGTFLASQYVAGSVLFWLGGIFNYWRAWRAMKRATRRLPEPAT